VNWFARINGNFTTSSSSRGNNVVGERVAFSATSRRDALMGFIIKSAFWLGVVFSAMPLGQVSISDPASEAGVFLCSPAGAAWAERFAPKEVSYGLGAAGCAAIAAARVEGASSPGLRPSLDSRTALAHGSGESLTAADRQAPWMGRERRITSEGPTQSWRAIHPLGYKRVANTHPERQTVDY
jgi:hypothetical protein